MARRHHSHRGSRGFSPRKRARSEKGRWRTWPEGGAEPKIQGFVGYKVGMTHAFLVDFRPTSTTAGQEHQVPVTILEVPPVRAAGIRAYEDTPYGLRVVTELWAETQDPELSRRLPVRGPEDREAKLKVIRENGFDEVRLICHTHPSLVTGTPKKAPEIFEVRVAGGTAEERLSYALERLGKDLTARDFTHEGAMIDITAVTKGKGFQGHIQRWGVKLLSHKNSKHRRMIGTAGPWNPHWTMPTVPQAGQMGFHQRTEYNKRVLKIGDRGEEVTPKGGFLHYGVVRSSYLIVHGSVPGPTKRLVRLRDATRFRGVEVAAPEIRYLSLESKQGV